jgi:hypothetical protein
MGELVSREQTVSELEKLAPVELPAEESYPEHSRRLTGTRPRFYDRWTEEGEAVRRNCPVAL